MGLYGNLALPQDGDGFFICEDQEEFLTSKILENYNFKTNSYDSFIRQLNYCKYSPCNFCFLSLQDKLNHVPSCSEIPTIERFGWNLSFSAKIFT